MRAIPPLLLCEALGTQQQTEEHGQPECWQGCRALAALGNAGACQPSLTTKPRLQPWPSKPSPLVNLHGVQCVLSVQFGEYQPTNV